jgi:polar amino acid transport system substrate-binding protein
MEAFMDLLAVRRVQTDQLVSHRFSIDQATNAYALLTGERHEPYIGILLQYDPKRPQPRTITIKEAATAPALSESKPALRLGVIGAGQFAQGILLPRLRKIKEVEIAGIATGSGVTARTVADKYHCRFCTSDFREILNTAEIDAVLIATRHDLHARIVSEALAAGKQIFVEKPLALNEIELAIVMAAYRAVTADNRRAPILTVGYNRRFSPISVLLKQAMSEHNVPLTINYRINAGSVPADSWIQNPDVGGGRIVGEVCHFVDFMQFLTSAEPVEVYANALAAVHAAPSDPDSLGAQIRFSDGSIGVITYVANGDPGFAKERVEVFGGGRTGVVDNWRSLQVTGQGKKVHLRSWLTSAKGHFEELVAFTKSAQTGVPAIEYRSLILTARATFAIQRSLRSGQPVSISFDDERDSALTAAS